MVLLCWPWPHCRHGGGSPAVLRDMVSTVAFVITSFIITVVELVATIPGSEVVAPTGLDGLQVKASMMDPILWWVGSYMCLVSPYLDGGLPY